MSKSQVKEIIDAIGADTIESSLGVSEFAVRHARRNGMFAASWYDQIRKLCDGVGQECPMSCFNWKSSLQADAAPCEVAK